MLDAKIGEILKTKIGAEKVTIDGKEIGLFDLVADWEDGLTKTRSTNQNLKAEKEALEKEIKEAKATLEKLSKFKDLTDDDLAKLDKVRKGGSVDKDEVTRQINALNDMIKQLNDKVVSTETSAKTERERARAARLQSEQDRLRVDVVSELSKHRIVGTQADAVFALMEKGGLFALSDKEGNGERFDRAFIVKKDGREMASDLAGVCKTMAEQNPWAISPSGAKGTGENHNSNPDAGSPGAYTGKESLQDLRGSFYSGLGIQQK